MSTLTRGRMAHVRDCRIEDYLALAGPMHPHLPPRLIEGLAEALTTGGPAFACTWGEELLLCAGLTLYPWPGVARAWALLSPAGKARPLVVHRAVTRFLDRLIAAHRIERVEAHVLEGDRVARAWVERLGFTYEGRAPRWGPRREPACHYARLTLPPISGGTGVGEAALLVGAIAAVAGTAVATTGVIMNAQQQKKAAGYQAAVADQQVELANVAGAAAEADTRDRARRVMAAQRAALGEGGITQEGTPLLVLMDTAQQAELDALRARYSGQVAAHGPSIEADLARQRGKYAQTAGIFGAGSTLLTGATNVAGIYASGSRKRPPTTYDYGAGPPSGTVGFSGPP